MITTTGVTARGASGAVAEELGSGPGSVGVADPCGVTPPVSSLVGDAGGVAEGDAEGDAESLEHPHNRIDAEMATASRRLAGKQGTWSRLSESRSSRSTRRTDVAAM
jgi:hypothetical protein